MSVLKNLKLNKASRRSFMTYAVVILAFVILQSLAGAGAMSSMLKGLLGRKISEKV